MDWFLFDRDLRHERVNHFFIFFLNDIHLSLFHFFSKILFCICEIQQNLYMCKCFHNCVDMCPYSKLCQIEKNMLEFTFCEGLVNVSR